MSRTYSSFLLFESVLDSIGQEAPDFSRVVSTLLNPNVPIVEEDCNTLLGKMVDTTNELQGYIESETKEVLTIARINQLLGAGKYIIGIRNLRTCQSHRLGGVCRTCYKSSLFTQTAPLVGNNVTIPSLLVYQSDVLVGDGHKTEFILSQTSGDWDKVIVIQQGLVVSESSYVLGTDTITFLTPLSADTVNGIVTVHFLKQNSDPFLGYISKTYSGGLLGMSPLPSLDMLLRESIYEDMFSDTYVTMILSQVLQLKAIPSTYKDFLDKVHSKLERLLMGMYLFSIYSDVQA